MKIQTRNKILGGLGILVTGALGVYATAKMASYEDNNDIEDEMVLIDEDDIRFDYEDDSNKDDLMDLIDKDKLRDLLDDKDNE